MCNLSKGVEEKALLRYLVLYQKPHGTMGLTIEQAMAALKVPRANVRNIWICWNGS